MKLEVVTKKEASGNINTYVRKRKDPLPLTVDALCKVSAGQPLVKCNLADLPGVHSDLASVLPVDTVAYKALEQQVCRGDKTPILYTCDIERKTFLLSDHMLMDIIIKHNIDEFYVTKIDIVDTVDKGVWWIIENCYTFPQYPLFVQIKILLDQLPRYEKLAKENMRLGGIHKGETAKVNGFQPINCLKLISKRVGCSPELVNEVKYILNNGTPQDIKKCEEGKAITTIYKEVKKQKRKDPENNAGYDQVEFKNPSDGTYIDQVHQGDNLEKIKEMQFAGVQDLAAMIFSSNYNIGMVYGDGIDDSIDHDEFINKVANVMYEGQKLGRDGMRVIAILPQTANQKSQSGGDYRYSLMADLIYKIKELNAKYDEGNLRFWGHFDWYKQHAGGTVCQGSISATCPVFRPDAEYIAVWVKNTKKLENIHGYDYKPQKPTMFNDSDRDKYIITPEEYYKWTLQTWAISPSSKPNLRHPAMYPEEICHRLIKLFTHPLDCILDPYSGSGTTLVSAKKLKRHFIGIDLQDGYCQLAKDRLAELDSKGGVA